LAKVDRRPLTPSLIDASKSTQYSVLSEYSMELDGDILYVFDQPAVEPGSMSMSMSMARASGRLAISERTA
jgi:hypothetical protein